MTETNSSKRASRIRAERIEGLLPRIMRMLYRTTEDSLLSELPLAQMRIVRLLYSGSSTVTSLGEELGLTSSAITQLLNRLQEIGFVERVEDPADRRVKHVALTELARARMRARQERRIGRMQIALERLSPERQCEILEAIEALALAGGEMNDVETLSYVAELEQSIPPVAEVSGDRELPH